MTKQFNTRIDDSLDLRLRLYAAHLSCTKAEAGARAMSQGIPSWVMAVSPSQAKRMTLTSEDEEPLSNELDDFEQAFNEATGPGLENEDD